MNIGKAIFKQALSLYLSRKIMNFAILLDIKNNQVILVENDSVILSEIRKAYEQQNLIISYFKLNDELLKILQDFISDIDYTLRANTEDKKELNLMAYPATPFFFIEEN